MPKKATSVNSDKELVGTSEVDTSKHKSAFVDDANVPSGMDDKVYKLGNWISSIFKIDSKKANLISKTLISVSGSLITITIAIVTLLKGLGVF